jgi:hypothetical protein
LRGASLPRAAAEGAAGRLAQRPGARGCPDRLGARPHRPRQGGPDADRRARRWPDRGRGGWRSWPIDPAAVPASARQDAEQAALLADYLKLDHEGWLRALWEARLFGRRRDFRLLLVALTEELESRERLDADELRRIHEATKEAELCGA